MPSLNCELPYIEKTTVAPELKARLTEIHLDLMRELLSYTTKEGNLFSPMLNDKRQKVLTLFDEKLYPLRRNAQLNAILDLNKKYKTVLNDLQRQFPFNLNQSNEDVITLKTMKLFPSAKAKDREVVVVNLSNYTFEPMPQDINMDDYKEMMVDELFRPDYIESASRILDEIPKHSELILQQLDTVFTKLSAYKQNYIDSNEGSHEFQGLETKMKLIYNILKFGDSALKITRVADIITEANNILEKGIISKLEGKHYNTKLMLERLDPNDPEYMKNIGKIARTVAEAHAILGAIQPLQDILTTLKVQNGFSFWEDYNTFRVEREFKNLLDLDQQAKVMPVLSNPNITNRATLFAYVAQALDVKQSDPTIVELEKALTKSEIGTNHISKAFSNILANITSVQESLKFMHYDLLGKVIYNQQLSLEGVTDYDDLPEDKKKYLKPLEAIKKDLEVTTQDIKSLDSWMASGADMEDVSAKLLVSFVSEQITLGTFANKDLAALMEFRLKALGLSVGSEQRKAYDKAFVEDIIFVDPSAVLQEADDEYEGETYKAFGKVFKVKKQKGFIQDINFAKSTLDTKAHKHTLDERSKHIFGILAKYPNKGALSKADFDKISKEDFKYLQAANVLFVNEKQQIIFERPKTFTEANFKRKLNAGFYATIFRPRTGQEINDILQAQLAKTSDAQLTFSTLLTELNKEHGPNSSFKRYIQYNTQKVVGMSKPKIYTTDFSRMLGVTLDPDSDYLRTIVLNEQGVYEELILTDKDEYGNYVLSEADQRKTFIALKNIASEPRKSLYGSPNYAKLNALFAQDPTAKAYYDMIQELYSQANTKRGSFYQSYKLLPNIAKDDTATLKQLFTQKGVAAQKINSWVENLKFSDDTDGILYGWVDGERVYVNEKGEPVDEPVYLRLQDQYGDVSRELRPKYTRNLRPGQTVEDDLVVSMFMFGVSSNNYDALKRVDSVVPVLKVVLKGDSTIGISERKAFKRGANKKNLAATLDNTATVAAKNSTATLMAFMNEYALQLNNEDFSVAGLSAQRLSGLIKGLNAYQTLAWNLTSSLTNLSLGTTSNFLVAHGKKHGLNKQKVRAAYATYVKNSPKFAVDFTKSAEAETSRYTQIAEYFDAIKGNYEDGRGTFQQKDLGSRFTRGALFFSSSMPEHMNQMTLMIAMLNSFEVKPATATTPAVTMNDIIVHQDGKPITFDFAKVGISEEEAVQVKLRFFGALERMNQEAHGQYASMDKNRLQRHAIFSLSMQFSKWMYSGYKARYRDETYDTKSAEILDEGYFKTYFKFLTKDIKEANEELEGINFLDTVKNYLSVKGLKTVGSLAPQFIFKQILGAADRIPSLFGLGQLMPSKQISVLDEWLYGDKLDKRRTQIMRANLELSIFLAAYLFGLAFHALADDEDDVIVKKILQGLELQSKRLYNDIGFYTVFTNPLIIADKIAAKLKDPFSVTRMYDNNVGLLSQLLWGEVKDGELNFYINDKYEKSGAGYEKGDYKIEKKFMKTFGAPFYQMIRFLNPQEQIQFLNVLYKNS